jgi:hypothetical protein
MMSSKSFIQQQMHCLLILENSKIYIKTWIKIAPTCFGPRPSSESLQLSLAEVTLTLKQSVKLRRYILYGGVAACYVQVWCVCAVCCVLCRASLCQNHNGDVICRHSHNIFLRDFNHLMYPFLLNLERHFLELFSFNERNHHVNSRCSR